MVKQNNKWTNKKANISKKIQEIERIDNYLSC